MLNNDKTQCVDQETKPVEQETESVELKTRLNLTSYSYATYAVVLVGVVSNIIASIVTDCSPQGAWAIINQLQILIVLPLMFVDFNTKVINYVFSLETALFSYSFISVQDWIPSKFIDIFDFNQQNEYLNRIELKSGSTLINNLSIL